MNPSLLSLFPRASKSFIDANPQSSTKTHKNSVQVNVERANGKSKDNETPNRSETPSTEPEQSVGQKPLDLDQGKTGDANRCVLRYTSRRCRLLDEDNWCTKYFTDALRYCGALSNDTPDKVTISVMQEKVSQRCQEETVIELEYPPVSE